MGDIPFGRLRQDLGDIVRQVESLIYLKDVVDLIAKTHITQDDLAAAQAALDDVKLQLRERQAELAHAAAAQAKELAEQKRLHEAALIAKAEAAERAIAERHLKATADLKAIEAQVNAKRDDLTATRREFTSAMALMHQQEADLAAKIKVLDDSLAKHRERVL